MMETYQDMQALEMDEPSEASFATVAAIYDDGLTLLFDGQETVSEKRYKCNIFCVFHPGDRVRVIKDSGTYVVEYPVGAPRKTFEADFATHAETAGSAESADFAMRAENADFAARAENADYAASADTATSANSANTANTANRATLAQRIGSNGGTSTYIQLMVNSNGYFINSNYSSGWKKISVS